MVALDLDGTVLDDQKRITPRTLETLQRALSCGVIVLPATGRTVEGIPKELLALRGLNYAVTSNGALVVRLEPREVLHRCLLARETALAVWDLLAREDCVCDVFSGGQGYTSPWNRAHVHEYAPPELLGYVYASREVVPDLRAFLLTQTDGIEKLTLFFRDLALRDRLQRELRERFGLAAVVGAPHNLELSDARADKGRGLLALAAALGVPREETLACGDSGNDRTLLEAAGVSVAMANSTPEILALADFVTRSNQEDGVAWALEQLVEGL